MQIRLEPEQLPNGDCAFPSGTDDFANHLDSHGWSVMFGNETEWRIGRKSLDTWLPTILLATYEAIQSGVVEALATVMFDYIHAFRTNTAYLHVNILIEESDNSRKTLIQADGEPNAVIEALREAGKHFRDN